MTRDEYDKKLQEWRTAEAAAAEADGRLRVLGQATSDPRVQELFC